MACPGIPDLLSLFQDDRSAGRRFKYTHVSVHVRAREGELIRTLAIECRGELVVQRPDLHSSVLLATVGTYLGIQRTCIPVPVQISDSHC